ncbi:hypothetical protein [Cetobacterium ceti]
MQNKLKILIENLKQNFAGKEDTIKLSLLALLSQEDIVLLGPRGVGKNEISKKILEVINFKPKKFKIYCAQNLNESINLNRLLLKKIVNYVPTEEFDMFFNVSSPHLDKKLKISSEDILNIDENMNRIIISINIKNIFKKIILDLRKEFENSVIENITDTKIPKLIKILKISAYTNNRKEVDITDIFLLKNCLWNDPSNEKLVENIILKNIFQEKNNKKTKFFFKGEGTKDNPFLIENEIDLKIIGTENYINKGYYFKQKRNIKIKSSWISLGSDKVAFQGNYDGDNKIIYNLEAALFFKIKNSKITNLFLKRSDIKSDLEKIGILINISFDSTVTNCTVIGKIYSNYYSSYIGGLIGWNERTTVSNCYINCELILSSITSYYYCHSGGITGWNQGGNIFNCSVHGTFYFTASFHDCFSCCGGIVGWNEIGQIQNCFTNIIVDFISSSYYSSSYGGGIVGWNEKGKILNCFTKNKINSISYYFAYTGGLIGWNEEGCISDCVVYTEIITSSSFAYSSKFVGKNYYRGNIKNLKGKGIIKDKYVDGKTNIEEETKKELYDVNYFKELLYNFLNWDFKNDWIWKDNKKFPYLKKINILIKNNNIDFFKMKKNNIWL